MNTRETKWHINILSVFIIHRQHILVASYLHSPLSMCQKRWKICVCAVCVCHFFARRLLKYIKAYSCRIELCGATTNSMKQCFSLIFSFSFSSLSHCLVSAAKYDVTYCCVALAYDTHTQAHAPENVTSKHTSHVNIISHSTIFSRLFSSFPFRFRVSSFLSACGRVVCG